MILWLGFGSKRARGTGLKDLGTGRGGWAKDRLRE